MINEVHSKPYFSSTNHYLEIIGGSFFTWSSYIFFFTMLVFPTAYTSERGFLLIIVIIGLSISSVKNRWFIEKDIFILSLTCIASSLLFFSIGIYNDTPGAISVSTVFIIWPLLYTFIVGGINIVHAFALIKIIILGSIASSAMAIFLLIGKILNFNATLLPIYESQGAVIGLYDGRIEYRLYNMSTVIYSVPFLLAILSSPLFKFNFNQSWIKFTWIALFLSLFVLVISGRRAFWVSAFLSPFIVFFFYKVSGSKSKIFSVLLKLFYLFFPLFIMGSILLEIEFIEIYNDFIMGFEFTDQSNYSAYRRNVQLFDLISAWSHSPLMGNGLGATVDINPLNRLQPWAYELSYISLLFQTGIVGLVIYSIAVIWIFYRSIVILKNFPQSHFLIIPAVSGLAIFLLINASNPYLYKFDYLWTLFLPVAIINIILIECKNDRYCNC
jgi:hypothetical protein